MDWSNETVMEFLELYERESIIWNASDPNHKNRNQVLDAWKRIEIKMGLPYSVADLKKKKESLMASFRNCLKKVQDSIKSGASADSIFKPSWFGYEKMSTFLRNKAALRETPSSEDIQSQNDETEQEDVAANDDPPNSQKVPFNPRAQTDSIVKASGSQYYFEVPRKKKKKFAKEEAVKKNMDSAILQSCLQRPAKERSVCDIYGELVAEKLKAMDKTPGSYVCIVSTILCLK